MSSSDGTQDDNAPVEDSGDFQLLDRFLDPQPAFILHSLLESEGIPAVLADADAVRTSFAGVAVGGVRVLVPATYLAEARSIQEAFKRGDYALEDAASDTADSTPDAEPVSHVTGPIDIRKVVLTELCKEKKSVLLFARALALLVDYMIFFGAPPLLVSLGLISPSATLAVLLGGFIFALAVAERLWGATPGKLIMGLRLITSTAQRPDIFQTLLRRVLLPIDLVGGAVAALMTPQTQRVGDIVTGVYVVRTPRLAELRAMLARFEKADRPTGV